MNNGLENVYKYINDTVKVAKLRKLERKIKKKLQIYEINNTKDEDDKKRHNGHVHDWTRSSMEKRAKITRDRGKDREFFASFLFVQLP